MPTQYVYSDFVEKTPFQGGRGQHESMNVHAGSITATRLFEGSWSNRLDFVFNYLFGKVIVGEQKTTFIKPNPYPDIKGIYVSQIEIDGVGVPTYDATDKKTIWERAVIQVTYSRMPYDQAEGSEADEENYTNYVHVSESIDSHVEVLTTPGADITIGGIAQHEEGDETKVIPTASIILNRNGIIVPPWTRAGFLLGRVNSTAFVTPSGFVCPAETLRFDGPSGDTKVNIFDQGGLLGEDAFPFPVWDFSLKFEFNPNGWNNKWHKGSFQAMLVNGNKMYQTGNLWPLVFNKTPDDEFNNNLDLLNVAANGVLNLLNLGFDLDNPAVLAQEALIKQAKANLGFRI